MPKPVTPNAYGLFVYTTSTDEIGVRNMSLIVSLLNYPTATSAVVNFKIRVDPCIVTSFTPPTDFSISNAIGAGPQNTIFNFV